MTSGAAPLALAAAALLAAADSHPPDVPAARPVAALRADHMVLDTALHESRVLAATQSGRVEVFDWKEGTALAPLLRLESASDRDYPPTVTSVDVSPGGGLIAAASSEGEIRILRFGSGAADEVRTLTARGVRVCRFLDDARLLVGDLRGEVALVELEGERERYRRQLEYDPVYALAIDPARRRVAVGFRSSRIQILDARSGETLQTLQGHRDSVYDLAWQGEHALLSVSKDKRLLGWDLAAEPPRFRVLYRGDDPITALALDPTGARVAASLERTKVGLLGLPSGTLQRWLEGHTAPVQALAFVGDGRYLISAGNDARLFVWDVAPGAEAAAP